MDKLHIVCGAYKPNKAPINRLLAFVSAFDKLNIETELVFIYPDAQLTKVTNSYKNITIKYLWDKHQTRNKIVKYLRSFYDAYIYANTLKNGEKVLLFGSGQYLSLFVKQKKISVYHERTEHPEVIPLKPRFLQHIYLNSCKKLAGLFVISTGLKDYFNQIGVKNVHIINMIVDSNRFKGLHKKPHDSPYIAYCGTASNNKDGVDELIKAFSIVHKQHPEYRLVIMGKAPTKRDDSGNMELVEELGLSNYVIFSGIIPAHKMPQKLVNASIVALNRPDSLQAKCGFPTKLGEYLLSKNPVVVTAVGDIPLFLADGVNALVTIAGDNNSFAEKMLWAIEHPIEAKQIGEQGYYVAMREFNCINEANKIIKIIYG